MSLIIEKLNEAKVIKVLKEFYDKDTIEDPEYKHILLDSIGMMLVRCLTKEGDTDTFSCDQYIRDPRGDSVGKRPVVHIYLEIEFKNLGGGYHTPANFSGDPDGWTPPDSEDDEVTLEHISISIDPAGDQDLSNDYRKEYIEEVYTNGDWVKFIPNTLSLLKNSNVLRDNGYVIE